MTAHTLKHPTELTGPASITVDCHLEIGYEHERADPSVGVSAGITIHSIVLVIGGQTVVPFEADHQDAVLVAACWQHWQDEKERLEGEHADFLRGQRQEPSQ